MPPKEFTPAEESIIKNMMLSRSHKDIAHLLACDKKDVRDFITLLTTDTSLVTYQMKLDQRAAGRPRPVKVKPLKTKKERPPSKAVIEKEKKHKERIARIARQQVIENERKRWRREPEFKTREVDYKKMISVKVDHKTYLQVPAGSDIEALKKNYLNRVKNSKVENTHYKLVKKLEV